MNRILLLFLFVSFSYSITHAKDVGIKSAPHWITRVGYVSDISDEKNGGYQYLLLDFQDNLIEQSRYRHYAIGIHNSKGIQSMSDIDVSFDPSYQRLDFHSIRIIREGEVIEKLKETDIQVIQREKNHERSLYDGSLTAIVNMTDVRAGDIIEYSYTLTGFNPIKQGNYSKIIYHQYSLPVVQIYNRIVTSPGRPLYYKLLDGAAEPEITQSNEYVEYAWNNNNPDLLLYEDNTPSWFAAGKRVTLSTYRNWQGVIESALPLYEIEPHENDKLKYPDLGESTKEERILRLIELIQDDIRYLGMESGIGAYKPHAPSQVYNQRYGDCKDKSLLLVALLRREGIQAFPLLINTKLNHKVEELMPGYNAFDHCIVNFQYDGKEYFVDPTISGQGGNLESICSPGYKRGLLLKPGETGLISIPDKGISELNIEEDIYVESIGGKARFIVKSEYIGRKADNIRSYFWSQSRESIQKEYLEYYSYLYPGIKKAGEIKIMDDEKSTSNRILVEETYEIDDFWQEQDDGSYIYCESYALVLESEIDYPKSPERNMPYSTGEVRSFSQITRIHMPESWRVDDEEVTIEGDGFTYHSETSYGDQTVIFTHRYDVTKEYIVADSVASFLTKHEQITDELGLYLTYQDLSGFKISWGSILLALLTLGGGIFLAVRIYSRYDPERSPGFNEYPIGSWLVLPAIGFIISPFVILYQIFNESYFNMNTWTGLLHANSDKELSLFLLGGFEFIYNLLLLVLMGLILFLFFRRRTSAPRIITIYLAVTLIVSVVDLIWVESAAPGLLPSDDKMDLYKGIGQNFARAALWIPVFNVSQRVKETFSKKYNNT
ncbi:MAG: DUF3857 domain-containing protein [Bacteroidota bacterium]